MRSLLSFLLVVALYPDTALCQGSSSPLARADVAASIGSFSAKRSDAAEYNQWTHSLVGGVGGGYYWSDHLKTEIDVASAGRGGSLRLRTGPLPRIAALELFSGTHVSKRRGLGRTIVPVPSKRALSSVRRLGR